MEGIHLLSIGLGLIVIGISLGIGNIGKAALDSMARQPEISGKIQAAMLIAAGLIEGAGLFAIVVALMKG